MIRQGYGLTEWEIMMLKWFFYSIFRKKLPNDFISILISIIFFKLNPTKKNLRKPLKSKCSDFDILCVGRGGDRPKNLGFTKICHKIVYPNDFWTGKKFQKFQLFGYKEAGWFFEFGKIFKNGF